LNPRIHRFAVALTLSVVAAGTALATPIITVQPVSILNLVLGGNAAFTVTAESDVSTNLAYQWYRNGVVIPGATNSSLGVTNAQPTDCGAFSVAVDDGEAAAVSQPADFTLNILQLLGGTIENALDLTNGVIRSYNFGAQKEAGEPDIIPGDPGGSSIWFKWTPLASGIVTFSTLGSDFDTILGIYTGSAPSNLVQVPSAVNDDDAAGYLCSQVSFNAKLLTTYLIAVDGYYGIQGNVVLSWGLDLTQDKLPDVGTTPAAVTSSNGATVMLTCPWKGNNCDWLFNGQVVATNTSPLVVTNLSGTNVGAYTARFTTPSGFPVFAEPTHLEINTLQDGSTATNSVAFVKLLDSANFDFFPPLQGNLIKLDDDTRGYSTSQVYSTSKDANEPDEPTPCGQKAGHPSWYSYVTPVSGTLVVNTAGSTFSTVLGVYIGPGNSFTTLTNIGCGYTTSYQANGQPSVTIPNVPANQTNFIMVGGYSGASGTVDLNIYLGQPVAVASPPQSQSAGPGTNVTLALSVTGATPITYSWQYNGAAISGATTGTLDIGGMSSTNAGTYTVIASNLVSVVVTQAVVSLALPPSITTQPQSQTVALNGGAALSVAASGTPAPSYQWLFNGAPSGIAASALNISSFQETNQGTYCVVISNFLGAVTSAPAVLLLNYPYRVNCFSMAPGGFQLEFVCPSSTQCVIEASSNFVQWTPVFTNTASNGFLDFTDTNVGASMCRFYRGVTN
jgi:hypothetical protein